MARIEHDFIGDLEVPANAYYGVQSLRGKENFFITEEKNNQEIYFIIAFAYVKSDEDRKSTRLNSSHVT